MNTDSGEPFRPYDPQVVEKILSTVEIQDLFLKKDFRADGNE